MKHKKYKIVKTFMVTNTVIKKCIKIQHKTPVTTYPYLIFIKNDAQLILMQDEDIRSGRCNCLLLI